MDFQLSAALMGDLEGFQQGVRDAVSAAGRETMEAMADQGLGRLRASVREAGLGERLANAWRAEVYPKRGNALEPALYIYTKAPEIIRAQSGMVIRAGARAYLAIPIPGSPAEDFPNPRGPDTKVDYARARFGERLFMIPPKAGRLGMLAVEGAAITATGRVSVRQKNKRGQWGKGTMTIPLFWLVPQVTMKPALDPQADFDWISARFADEYTRRMADALVRAGLGD